jgi:thiamine-phosphate pyrophosphorylase
LCRRYGTPLLINDDVALCLAIGADGVHLGQNDSGLRQARERLGPSAIIGMTCHSDLALAHKAEENGASYVAFGRFFPSVTKPHAVPADIGILPVARAALKVPIVAIGGINAENGGALITAGADMLAVIHDLFAFPDVEIRARALNSLFASPR